MKNRMTAQQESINDLTTVLEFKVGSCGTGRTARHVIYDLPIKFSKDMTMKIDIELLKATEQFGKELYRICKQK